MEPVMNTIRLEANPPVLCVKEVGTETSKLDWYVAMP